LFMHMLSPIAAAAAAAAAAESDEDEEDVEAEDELAALLGVLAAPCRPPLPLFAVADDEDDAALPDDVDDETTPEILS
jgi:hypothetical protein